MGGRRWRQGWGRRWRGWTRRRRWRRIEELLAGEQVVRVGRVKPMLVGEDIVHLNITYSEPLTEAIPHGLPRRCWDEAAPSDVEGIRVALCECRRVRTQHLPATHFAAHDDVIAAPGVVSAAPVGCECATKVGERRDGNLFQ